MTDKGTETRAAIPCRYFQSGYCWRGQDCWYQHVSPSDGAPNDDAAVSVESTSNSSKICGICLEEPKLFGLLTNCAHVYCFSCIKEWRSTKQKDGDQVLHAQTCPLCRIRSDLVTPSNSFIPHESASKQAAIDRYKAVMKRKPCQMLLKSVQNDDARWCPFGKDCWYSHTLPNGETVLFDHTHADSIRERTERRARRQERREWRQSALMRDVARALRYNVDSDDSTDEEDWDDESTEEDDDEEESTTESSSSAGSDESSEAHSVLEERRRTETIARMDQDLAAYAGIRDGDSTDTIEQRFAEAVFGLSFLPGDSSDSDSDDDEDDSDVEHEQEEQLDWREAILRDSQQSSASSSVRESWEDTDQDDLVIESGAEADEDSEQDDDAGWQDESGSASD